MIKQIKPRVSAKAKDLVQRAKASVQGLELKLAHEVERLIARERYLLINSQYAYESGKQDTLNIIFANIERLKNA